MVTARGAHRGKRRIDGRARVDYQYVAALQKVWQLRETRVMDLVRVRR